jgi:hypothetical protein
MVDLLGHKFKDYATTSKVLDGRYKYFECINCNLIIYMYHNTFLISKMNEIFSFNPVETKELNLTCDEIMIKRIIE